MHRRLSTRGSTRCRKLFHGALHRGGYRKKKKQIKGTKNNSCRKVRVANGSGENKKKKKHSQYEETGSGWYHV